jgi:diaminobutyrate-2-oxoglutarate transaminase
MAAGYLADHIFEPRMQPGGQWAATLGQWWGTGQGRGAALMMSVFGVLSFVFVIITLLNRKIRRADLDLPDYETATETAKSSS